MPIIWNCFPNLTIDYMLLICYDIKDDHLRSKFSKFLKKYGHRIQFSVYEIKNSPRIVANIIKEIEMNFEKFFTGCDSVILVPTCETCRKKIIKFGYARNDDEEWLVFEG